MQLFVRRKHGAQAVAELAILAGLILMVFTAIVSYGQRYDRMVETKMRAFRKALKASYKRNAGVSYTLKEDARGTDMFSFGRGAPLTAVGSSSVLWQKGMSGTQKEIDEEDTAGSYAFYEVNKHMLGVKSGWDARNSDDEDSMPSLPRVKRYIIPKDTPDNIDNEDAMQQVYMPASIYKEDSARISNYELVSDRNESATSQQTAKVKTEDQGTLQEAVYNKVYMHAERRGQVKGDVIDEREDPDAVPEYMDMTDEDDTGDTDMVYRPVKTTVTRPYGQYDSGKTVTAQEIQYCAEGDEDCEAGETITATRDWTTK